VSIAEEEDVNRIERVLELLNEGHNCAEAIAGVFADAVGLSEEFCIRAATGFGAGMARTGHVCGLASGAILVLNLGIDRRRLDHVEGKEYVYSYVERLVSAVRTSHGSILCPEILGADLTDPADLQRILDERLFETRCHTAAERIVELVEALLDENPAADPTRT